MSYREAFDPIANLVAARASYEDVVAALDMLLANSPAYRAQGARYRVAIAHLYERPDDEIAAMLDAALTTYREHSYSAEATMQLVLDGCGYRRALITRFLGPAIDALREATPNDVLDWLHLAALLRLRLVQGVSPVQQAIGRVESMLVGPEPYEAIAAALDACLQLPGAEDARFAVAGLRLTAAVMHERPDDELCQLIEEVLALAPDACLALSHVSAATASRPVLMRRYLVPLLGTAEALGHESRHCRGEVEAARVALARMPR